MSSWSHTYVRMKYWVSEGIFQNKYNLSVNTEWVALPGTGGAKTPTKPRLTSCAPAPLNPHTNCWTETRNQRETMTWDKWDAKCQAVGEEKFRVWPRGGEPIKPKKLLNWSKNKNDMLAKKSPPRSQIRVNRWIDRYQSLEIYCWGLLYIYIYIYIGEEY